MDPAPWKLLSPLEPPPRSLLSSTSVQASAGEPVIDIPLWKLSFVVFLLAAPLAVSAFAGLHITKPLVIGGMRCLLQLLLLGGVLRALFASGSIIWVGLYLLFMMTVASIEAGSRPSMSYQGMHGHVGVSMVVSSFIALLYMLIIVIQPAPWYTPQYAIPLMGMMLGNSLTSVTVGVKTLLETLSSERAAVEWRLCMGATRWEAVAPVLRQVLQTALTPVINMLSVAGLISIPGMLTGQILAGSEPVVAAKYQIMVMFAIGAVSTVAVSTAVILATLELTDTHHCLRLDRLESSNHHTGRVAWNHMAAAFRTVYNSLLVFASMCGLVRRSDGIAAVDEAVLLVDGPDSSV